MKLQGYDPKTSIQRSQLKEDTVLVRRAVVSEIGYPSHGIN
jgi:hypothetical protein